MYFNTGEWYLIVWLRSRNMINFWCSEVSTFIFDTVVGEILTELKLVIDAAYIPSGKLLCCL